MVLGGVPHYLDRVRRGLSVSQIVGSRRTVQIVFVTTFGVKQNVKSQELVDRVITIDDLLR